MKRGVYLFPNLFTTGNLFMGFYSVVASLKGHFHLAAWAILVAIFFDVLDGKVARLMKATSSFGIQYDSLADLVSFGVAPGLLAYNWILSPLGRVGWLIAFFFLTCGALRLARFNIQADTTQAKKAFMGLPIPAAAAAVATTYLFVADLNLVLPSRLVLAWTAIMMVCLAFLMVSSIEYKAFKEVDPTKRHPFGILLLAVAILFILAAEPHVTLFAFTLTYVLSGPFLALLVARKSQIAHKEVEV